MQKVHLITFLDLETCREQLELNIMQDSQFVLAQAANPFAYDSFVYGKVNTDNTFEISRFGYPKKRWVVSVFHGRLKSFSTGTKIEGYFDVSKQTKLPNTLFKIGLFLLLVTLLINQLQMPIENLGKIVAISLAMAAAIWLECLGPPQNRYDEHYLFNFLADTIQAKRINL